MTSMNRRDALLTLAGCLSAPAWAQTAGYPTKPIKIICPFAPGGGSDFAARMAATGLTERLKSPVIVENRPGAGGVLGSELALKSPPDGYTLLLIAGSYTVNPSLYKLSFDPINDMTPVMQIARGAYVWVVHPSVPAKTLKEFFDYARANPGKVNYGSSGQGGHLNVVTEYMLEMAKVQLTHVPYKGTGPAITDLLGGVTQAMFAGTEGVMQHVKAGKLRALAVGTKQRLAAFPDIPSVSETLPDYDVVAWHGLVAPKGVPAEYIAKLNAELNTVMKGKEMAARLEPNGLTPGGGTAAEFGALIKTELDRYAGVIKRAGIKGS